MRDRSGKKAPLINKSGEKKLFMKKENTCKAIRYVFRHNEFENRSDKHHD